MVKKGKK